MKQLDIIGRLISALVRLRLFTLPAVHAAAEIGGERRCNRPRRPREVMTEEWSNMHSTRAGNAVSRGSLG